MYVNWSCGLLMALPSTTSLFSITVCQDSHSKELPANIAGSGSCGQGCYITVLVLSSVTLTIALVLVCKGVSSVLLGINMFWSNVLSLLIYSSCAAFYLFYVIMALLYMA
jgi:hypothetical protein